MNEIRCPKCGKLLFKAEGHGTTIQAECPRCKTLFTYPTTAAQVVPATPIPPSPTPEKQRQNS